MLIDELIEVVEKQKECVGCIADNRTYACNFCKNYVSLEKQREMFADIQMRLKQEKWMYDKMEEMKVEEVD